MSKSEFLSQLRACLVGRMGEEELKSALSYYDEYFEDAGVEREGEVLEELGSPAAVAAQVLEEQEHPYTPPTAKVKRTSRAGVIALCVGLGVVLFGVAGFVIFNFVSVNEGPRIPKPQVSVSADVTPVEPLAEPSVSTGQTLPNREPANSAFTNLDIKLGVGSVRVQTGEEWDFTLESSGTNKSGTPYELHYSLEGGLLRIWSTPKSLSTEGGDMPEGEVVITVPEGVVLGHAEVEVGMGELDWVGCAVAERLSAEIGMGDVDVKGGLTGEIDLKTGMGNITAHMALAREEYRYELEVGMGDLRLDGEKLVRNTAEGGSGPSQIELSSGMGDVRLTFGEK